MLAFMRFRKIHGGIPGPYEAWLALRGLRTFPLRFYKAQENALELAQRLSKHPGVSRVRYPGLPEDSQHARAKSFMRGFGAVVSFEVKDGPAKADRICENSQVITQCNKFGRYRKSVGTPQTLASRKYIDAGESDSTLSGV